MIFLFTDFGWNGPYAGQMAAVLTAAAPDVPVQPLMHDAPALSPRHAGALLAALSRATLEAMAAVGPVPESTVPESTVPQPTVFLAVVDPGVGTARRPLAVRLGGTWLVGPDNGLLAPTIAQALADGREVEALEITWRPARLSTSFHGRDLFAPVAARLARGVDKEMLGRPVPLGDLVGMTPPPGPLAEVVYIDVYGNAWTGLPADAVPPGASLRAGGRLLARAETFGAVPQGQAFWYANSSGVVEIAVNQGRADTVLGLAVGSPVALGD